MTENINLQKYVLPFAYMAALSRILIDFIPKTLSFGPIAYYSTFFIAFVLEIIFITYVIKSFKKVNGNLKLSEAIKIGVIIMLIVGIFYSTMAYVYDTFIDPNYQIETAIRWIEMFAPEKMDELRIQMQESQKQSSIFGVLLYTLWFIVLGFVISIISGSILKSKEIE